MGKGPKTEELMSLGKVAIGRKGHLCQESLRLVHTRPAA